MLIDGSRLVMLNVRLPYCMSTVYIIRAEEILKRVSFYEGWTGSRL